MSILSDKKIFFFKYPKFMKNPPPSSDKKLGT